MSRIDYKERVRRLVVLVAAVCLHAGAARGQDAYAAVLLKYLTGDADAAVAELSRLPTDEVHAGVQAFDLTRAPMVLTAAAAMHTEAAIRRGGGLASPAQLDIATAIVEFGEAPTMRANATAPLHPRYARPVPDSFRRLWYVLVINTFEGTGMLASADKYLAHATRLFPESAEIQLVAGVAEEMRASPRTSAASDRERRNALAAAEKRYRAGYAADPTRLEIALRLARVLQQRNQLAEASRLLTPLTTAPDARIAYLAGLFLGGVEDRLQRPDAAAALYERAAAQLPVAQAAALAASELRHRRGDQRGAADAVPAAAGPNNSFDPWWTYIFGEYWRVDLLLNAVRAARRS